MRILLAGMFLLGLAMAEGAFQNATPVKKEQGKPVSSPDHATDLTPQQIKQASALYTVKCAKCHEFYNPAGYKDAEWRSWMRKMGKKARLTSDQQQLLSRYLETFRN